MKTKNCWRKTIDKVRRNTQNQNRKRYAAKIYVGTEEIEEESFSSSTFEETAKHVLKDCVISNYFDMAETEG